MRSIETHIWPELSKQSRTAPSAARSRSASASTSMGFLPPSSSEQPTSRSGAALGDLAAHRRRAGEADEVAAVDDRAAHHRALAEDDLPEVGGQAGLDGERPHPQRGQRGLGVRLVHDAVAGDEGRDRVADREDERVVPRRDDADDALRVPDLVRRRQRRDQSRVPDGCEVAPRAAARSAGRSARRRRPPPWRRAAPCRSPAGPGRGPRPGGRAGGRAAAGRPRPAP